MAHRQALTTLTNKQTPNIQNGIKTNLDLRIGTMELCRIIQTSQKPRGTKRRPFDKSPTLLGM